MYGFHKIPHLQQGVLKSDTDTEFWNFAHANFHRGQPDLLCLIQRKKQMPQPGEDGSIDLRDPTDNSGLIGGHATGLNAAIGIGAPQPNPQISSGQVLDIHSIVNGITAIKRHQTTISAELNELKRSNQLLWQDALAARAKHQKQQDTINRIVKFLAGVFGHHAAGGVAGGVAAGSPAVPSNSHVKDDSQGEGTRRRVRLMIEDAKRDGPTKSMVEELTEMPLDGYETVYETSRSIFDIAMTLADASFKVILQ
jgi:heat shock transcription factor